jgi:hypothetical protein
MRIYFLSRLLYGFILFAFSFQLSTLLISPSHASVILKASVDRNKITIGDRITYTVVIEHDPEIQIKSPEPGANLGEFEIKDYEIIGPKSRYSFKKFRIRRKKVIEYRYTLTTFTTGEFKIPAVGMGYADKKGANKEIKSGEISIFVESVRSAERDKDDIRDIKLPVGIPRGWLFYFILILIPVLLTGGGLAYYLYEKRKREEIFTRSDSSRPADEVAYERLDKLEELDLIKQGRVKEYYIILSEIIRRYIEQRYSISVLDRTTNELYRQLRRVPEIDKKHCSAIKDFLVECDLVKFAKYKPEENIIAEDSGTARRIIDLTKPVRQQPVEMSLRGTHSTGSV